MDQVGFGSVVTSGVNSLHYGRKVRSCSYFEGFLCHCGGLVTLNGLFCPFAVRVDGEVHCYRDRPEGGVDG